MMKEWGADPQGTLVVGDYLYDLKMGRAAGTATVHVDQDALFPRPKLTDIHALPWMNSINNWKDFRLIPDRLSL